MWVTPNTAWGIAPAGPTSNVYNNNNQASTLSYDGSGRVTNTGSTSFSYDAENRQTQATDAPGIGGGTLTCAYDGAGERVKKQISGGAATICIYDHLGSVRLIYRSECKRDFTARLSAAGRRDSRPAQQATPCCVSLASPPDCAMAMAENAD